MGLFDFFKHKGVESTTFHSTQFQNGICALALLKLEENSHDPRAAISALKKHGLNDEQVKYILNKTQEFIKQEKTNIQLNSGIEETEFFSKEYQAEILAYAQTEYFQNDHSYAVVMQSLLKKALSGNQANNIISKLKKLNAEMVADFQEKLDSGVISNIQIKPNPKHTKGSVELDQVDRYIAYGAYQMERGDLDNALELFDKAIELDDKATLAYANKGSLFAKKGDNDKALHFYTKALEIEPNQVNVLENKMDLLYEIMNETNEKEFINTAKSILQNEPNHPNALIYVIQYHMKENDMENALKLVKILFAGYHSENIAIQLLLNIFGRLPQDEALNEFEIFITSLGEDAKYQLDYCKGLYLKGIGKYDEAIAIFKNLNRKEEFSWNYYQMAIINNLQSKPNEALNLLKITFELEPGLKDDAKQFAELQTLWTNADFIKLTK